MNHDGSSSEPAPAPRGAGAPRAHSPAHGPAEALQSLLRSAFLALFVVTFIVQPVVIPSESMEPTLLVGDFLLVNRIDLAPDSAWRPLLAAADPARQQIVTFRSSQHPGQYLIKRIVAIPGDRLRIVADQVWINSQPLREPYLAPQSVGSPAALANFPTSTYTDPRIDLRWWRAMQPLVHDGQLTVPPGDYFVLGDNRTHSLDSRYWGFVARDQIVASPVLVYFSLRRPSTPEIATAQPSDDRLGHDATLTERLRDAVRWSRLFRVVH